MGELYFLATSDSTTYAEDLYPHRSEPLAAAVGTVPELVREVAGDGLNVLKDFVRGIANFRSGRVFVVG